MLSADEVFHYVGLQQYYEEMWDCDRSQPGPTAHLSVVHMKSQQH